jgi:D-alanyl-lipoteichoic acid acyltransferase DltB (MBOAT superfamily)
MARDRSPKRRYLLISLALNLGTLGFFKYFGFFVESLTDLLSPIGLAPTTPLLHVVLPVGISFYTFQTLAYTIDVYRGREQATDDFTSFALYVSYFPQLVAGPIERSTQLLPQIRQPRRVDGGQIATGCELMLLGYLKKVAIADAVAPAVDAAFAAPGAVSSPVLWVSVYLFAIQIYCDFSGYTDIARGLSRVFGIELMLNFRQPYLSRNISEFWRRWHISLSSWLRDYLYVPLGGNQVGRLTTYRNLMVTMLLGGLWHGAAWTFVIWGGLHGLYLAVHRAWIGAGRRGQHPPPVGTSQWLTYMVEVGVTFHLVCLAWVFFRADSLTDALAYLSGIVGNGADGSVLGRVLALGFYGGLVLLLDFGSWRHDRELPLSPQTPPGVRGLAYATAFILISFLGESQGAPFIYFQF